MEAYLRGGIQWAKKVALAPLLSAPSLGPEQDDFMVQGRSSRQMGPGEQCNVSSYRRDMAWPLLGLQVLTGKGEAKGGVWSPYVIQSSRPCPESNMLTPTSPLLRYQKPICAMVRIFVSSPFIGCNPSAQCDDIRRRGLWQVIRS